MIEHAATSMGMPVRIILRDSAATDADAAAVMELFEAIDQQFSPYQTSSDVSVYNKTGTASPELRAIFDEAARTKRETLGYFDIQQPGGGIDPSGLVKGLAIQQAVELLQTRGLTDFQIDVGGDIALASPTEGATPWQIGIRNPFNKDEIVKVVSLANGGIATSGTAERGNHIYDPHTAQAATAIASITVVGPTIYDADRFATAAFAMGKSGAGFIESLPLFEAYAIDHAGIATMTSGFHTYTKV